jgi:hypothetical protein
MTHLLDLIPHTANDPAAEAMRAAVRPPVMALMAVLSGPASTAEDAQTVAQNVPFAQTPAGAPLLFPGADNRLLDDEPASAVFPGGDESHHAAYGSDTSFDCGAGTYVDGDADWAAGGD